MRSSPPLLHASASPLGPASFDGTPAADLSTPTTPPAIPQRPSGRFGVPSTPSSASDTSQRSPPAGIEWDGRSVIVNLAQLSQAAAHSPYIQETLDLLVGAGLAEHGVLYNTRPDGDSRRWIWIPTLDGLSEDEGDSPIGPGGCLNEADVHEAQQNIAPVLLETVRPTTPSTHTSARRNQRAAPQSLAIRTPVAPRRTQGPSGSAASPSMSDRTTMAEAGPAASTTPRDVSVDHHWSAAEDGSRGVPNVSDEPLAGPSTARPRVSNSSRPRKKVKACGPEEERVVEAENAGPSTRRQDPPQLPLSPSPAVRVAPARSRSPSESPRPTRRARVISPSASTAYYSVESSPESSPSQIPPAPRPPTIGATASRSSRTATTSRAAHDNQAFGLRRRTQTASSAVTPASASTARASSPFRRIAERERARSNVSPYEVAARSRGFRSSSEDLAQDLMRRCSTAGLPTSPGPPAFGRAALFHAPSRPPVSRPVLPRPPILAPASRPILQSANPEMSASGGLAALSQAAEEYSLPSVTGPSNWERGSPSRPSASTPVAHGPEHSSTWSAPGPRPPSLTLSATLSTSTDMSSERSLEPDMFPPPPYSPAGPNAVYVQAPPHRRRPSRRRAAAVAAVAAAAQGNAAPEFQMGFGHMVFGSRGP
jgi:hypothetical protein